MMSWIKLVPGVPEYGLYHEDDLDLLIQWFFDYEEFDKMAERNFIEWLHHLEMGVIVSIPRHTGYRIIKVKS